MSQATKAPPRKVASGTSNARTTRQPVQVETQSPTERRANGLMGLAQLGQGVLMMFGQYADAAAIGQHFQPVAMELSNVANSSEVVAKPIDFLIEIGPYGALISAVMPLALQIAANHRWVNAGMLVGQGVTPPEILEAQMKAQLARAQSEAMKAQRDAMQEAKMAQDEFEALMADQTQRIA